MSRLPNFFLVGAPKAGTTSLYHYLDQHPQIYLSPIKEPNYFAAEVREENFDPRLRCRIAQENHLLRRFLSGPMRKQRFGAIVTHWEDYLRLFASAESALAVGEASVCYLWSRTAPELIANRIPNAKILMMLRNPAERAFSQYLQGFGNGAIRWSLREHIRHNLGHRSHQFCTYYPFLELGLYSAQLQRYLERFERNVWVGLYEDFQSHPHELLRSLFAFLGVNSEFTPDMSRRYLEAQVPRLAAISWLKRLGLWQAAASLTPLSVRPFIRRALIRGPGTTHMDPADWKFLIEFYREDIGQLARLLSRNLDGWLQHD